MKDRKEKNVKLFTELLKKHGPTSKAVGWNLVSQRQRFEAISKIGDVHGHSLLDVGCGTGDYYAYLECMGKIPSMYRGIDITPEMITEAREKSYGATFTCDDIFNFISLIKYDYVIAIGLLNYKTQKDMIPLLVNLIERMYSLCNIGIGISMLSKWKKGKRNGISYYYDPIEVLKEAKKMSGKIVLDHSYLDNDFTLFMYK